ncbi:hypothetical protein NUU61_000552 [Penicillium alfredii]|uniref:Uncharacterized protein n=1 Tax=Penicillium alfredii TaxID=1506179 RepID=A0A9W9KR63_9EURO|nr:uncharacterized protein NUU61_000552 [Penicillium alfredii]KAJ5114793.1 hypothetical protein NUU61_000552 [Penicillium alfredii]
MKAPLFHCALLGSSLCTAIPVQRATQDTISRPGLTQCWQPSSSISERQTQVRPKFRELFDQLQRDLSVENPLELSQPGPSKQSKQSHLVDESHHSESNYVAHRATIFQVRSDHSNVKPAARTPSYFLSVTLFDIIDQHGPECVALALFVIAPIAYFLLDLLERAIKCCIREQFPRRGRDRVRLLGRERQLRAWSNWQRERVLASEKPWWQARSSRNPIISQ